MRGDDRDKTRPVRVAIIGTGLAGLTTAHLLQSDKQSRYHITMFEQANTLSFDSQSVAVQNRTTGDIERVDLPMRAMAGGYYESLLRLYNYLGICMHPTRFRFVFAEAAARAERCKVDERSGGSSWTPDQSYFIHSSNLHQIFPPRPKYRSVAAHILETLFIIVCYAWFTIATFLVSPKSWTVTREDSKEVEVREESIAEYLRRIRIPQRYATHYLVPLMSSVSTCTHDEQLAFPARDILEYKRLSHRQEHYTVCGGVKNVQGKLAEGLDDLRFGARVQKVTSAPGKGLLVEWQALNSSSADEVLQDSFDRVVLAVSPDVASRIFEPLAEPLGWIPTTQVTSSVVSPPSKVSEEKENGLMFGLADGNEGNESCMHHAGSGRIPPAQTITLRSRFTPKGSRSEALHAMPSGVAVNTCPLDPRTGGEARDILYGATFTRTLRSTKSQAVINQIMRNDKKSSARSSDYDDSVSESWANGDDNVWLAGAWCWDGMVLLEGCVVSAVRVARDFGVEIPW